MIAHKQIDDIAKLVIGLAVVVCLMLMLAGPALTETLGGTGVSMEYESKIFDTSAPVEIDIRIDPEEWQNMLDTATQEVYHRCDVVINGTAFQSVGIRPKGNTSLSSIAMEPDNDRYSFKIEFDQYVDGQTAWGLDKLCLNNNYSDATNMKEALVYDMYRFLEADASLYNYATIYVNGEYWGVYLAIEAVEDSFMLRNFGTQNGELYKPDSFSVGFDDDEKDRSPSKEPERTPKPTATPEPTAMPTDKPGVTANSGDNASASASASFDFPDFGGGGPGGGPFGGGGQNLNYTDDDPDSYSTIWKCEVTKTNDADHARVIEALKNISEGEKLEESMDIDNLLRMMAVHNFSVNGDSLSGGMAHNYYLYETDGQLNILSWDYNLALGGMGMGGTDASEIVNEPIDDSWSSTKFFDPLLENEEYLAKYHEHYQKLVDEYIFGGGFDEFYSRTRGQIDTLVATDPNALYDYDEYDTAADTLYRLVKLRGESIRGQLDGSIPSTTQGQRLDSANLIDTGDLDASVMGGFGGGPGGGGPGGPPTSNEPSGEANSSPEPPAASGEQETAASAEAAPTPTPDASGEASDNNAASGETSAEFSPPDFGGAPFFASGEMQENTKAPAGTWIACGIVLAAGLVFAATFRKKG